jgi:hypothetical protein
MSHLRRAINAWRIAAHKKAAVLNLDQSSWSAYRPAGLGWLATPPPYSREASTALRMRHACRTIDAFQKLHQTIVAPDAIN